MSAEQAVVWDCEGDQCVARHPDFHDEYPRCDLLADHPGDLHLYISDHDTDGSPSRVLLWASPPPSPTERLHPRHD